MTEDGLDPKIFPKVKNKNNHLGGFFSPEIQKFESEKSTEI